MQRKTGQIYYSFEADTLHTSTETIVFLHTNISDHTLFERMTPFLKGKFQLLTYDLRGLGRSELGGEQISIEVYVEDLKALLEALNIAPVHLVGMGFGGLIALKFSALYTNMVKKMVLMTLPCFPEETLHTVQEHRRKISAEGTKIPAINILKKATLLKTTDPEFQRFLTLINQVDVSIYMKIMELTITANTLAYMKNNKLPTLILSGEREIVFPQNLLAFNAAYLPNYQYAVVPNASSFLMIDQPEITAQLTLEFLYSTHEPKRYQDDISDAISNHVRSYTQHVYQEFIINSSNFNQIQVDFLHAFRVQINGASLLHGWNQRYAKQIMLYLLFHPTAIREEMCDALWPDVPLNMAKKNVRVYLSHLKNILNPYSLNEAVLIVDREHIYLNGKVSSDALTFIADIEQALQYPHGSEKYEMVRRIVNRLTSPKNYMMTIYDNWFLEIRNKVENNLLELILWMGEWLILEGDLHRAISYLSNALPMFDDDERIYDLLNTIIGDHSII